MKKNSDMTTKSFHVYADDGFESAHASQSSAERAAKRGAKRRGIVYRVVKASASGLTGGGYGTVVAEFGRPA